MKKRILVRVDFQNDFVDPDGKLTITGISTGFLGKFMMWR